MKRKGKILLFILIIIDELIKLIIYFNFMEFNIRIIKNKFAFRPFINKDQLSIFNNELNMSLNINVLIILNIASIAIIFLVYIWFKNKTYTDNYFEKSITFISAGCICSLIDKATLKGSLDYIQVFNKIVDLKDLYLLIGIVFLCIYLVRYNKFTSNKKVGNEN